MPSRALLSCSFIPDLKNARTLLTKLTLKFKGIQTSSKMCTVPPLVSCSWLQEKLGSANFLTDYMILDSTWDLKMTGRDFRKEHFDQRIPGARRFDIDECADKTSKLAHMLPSAKEFAAYMSKLGVKNSHHIILYDNSTRFGLFSAPRVWWTLHVFGHKRVSILDGGLPKWKAEGFVTCTGEYDTEEKSDSNEEYSATLKAELVVDLQTMLANAKATSPVQVMDARPNGRFMGTAPEPRADIPSGHMPNTLNIPFFQCFDMEKKIMKPKEELLKVFQGSGIDLEKEVISTCGSGVTASVLAFAVYYASGKDVKLYDGSWTEWATSDTVPSEMIVRHT